MTTVFTVQKVTQSLYLSVSSSLCNLSLGSSSPRKVKTGYYTVGSNMTRIEERICEKGFWCFKGLKFPCRAGSYGDVEGLGQEFESYCSGLCSPG